MTFMQIFPFFSQVSVPSLLLFDSMFLIAFIVYLADEIRLGFFISFLNLVSICIGYILALMMYRVIAVILQSYFSLSPGFADATAFVALSFLISFTLRLGLVYLQRFFRNLVIPRFLYYGGALVTGTLAFFFLSLVLITLFLSFPLAKPARESILNSFSGKALLSYSFVVERDIKTVFGQAIQDSLHFMTVKPKPNESVALHFSIKNVPVDKKAEQAMSVEVNNERKVNKKSPLVWSEALAAASRAHAADMAQRSYFSHYTPEGLSPFDRLARRTITYAYAGENLALAPTVEIAMQGLMKSPGHRANILSPHFGKIGIGVIDMGLYGKMYVQTFSD